jgi:hypothetical protein
VRLSHTDGHVLWNKHLDGEYGLYAAVAVDGEGNPIVVGHVSGNDLKATVDRVGVSKLAVGSGQLPLSHLSAAGHGCARLLRVGA